MEHLRINPMQKKENNTVEKSRTQVAKKEKVAFSFTRETLVSPSKPPLQQQQK